MTAPYVELLNGGQEVSLLRLWLIVRKRWPWLVGGILCGIVVAIAYTATITPIYESRASIQVGKIQFIDSRLIDDLETLALQLVEQYGVESSAQAPGAPYLKQASKVSGLNNVLKLVVLGNSAEGARNFLAQILARLMARHEQIYSDILAPSRRRLTLIEERIGILTAQAGDLGQMAARLKEANPTQSSLAMMTRASLYTELNQLERDRLFLNQQIAKPYSSPSEIIASPTLPTTPILPKTTIVIAVGIMVGLALGLLAVFVRESFASLRTDQETDAASKSSWRE